MTLPSSTILGKFRLLAEIGFGGMAHVYVAAMEGPDDFTKLVALKILREEFSADHEARKMFLREARLAARLNHPNIVQTFEVGEIDGRHYIAMEYLEGQPLSRLLGPSKEHQNSPLPQPIALRIVAEVLAGLEHAHELRSPDGQPLGLVHRDISPQNIFVTYDGLIKVLDFGIAKATTGGTSQTAEGVLKGKIAYMAPEQIEGGGVDRRADVFAAGVVLWEALAGRKMWKGIADATIMHHVMRKGVPSLRHPLPDAPPELIELCARACARSRGERYASAAAMQEAVEAFLERHAQPGESSARAISKHLSARFSDVRAETKHLIDQQLVALQDSAKFRALPPVLLPHARGSVKTPLQSPSSATRFSAEGHPRALWPDSHRRREALPWVVFALSAIGVATFLLLSSKAPHGVAAVPPVMAPATASAAPSATPEEQPTAPPPPGSSGALAPATSASPAASAPASPAVSVVSGAARPGRVPAVKPSASRPGPAPDLDIRGSR